jgi:hypothetical protein
MPLAAKSILSYYLAETTFKLSEEGHPQLIQFQCSSAAKSIQQTTWWFQHNHQNKDNNINGQVLDLRISNSTKTVMVRLQNSQKMNTDND